MRVFVSTPCTTENPYLELSRNARKNIVLPISECVRGTRHNLHEDNEVMPTPPYEEIKQMRKFPTGATRDSEDGKLDYEGILSPYALKRYAEYMNEHRVQSNGESRASDNWQKGIPLSAYMKSLWRHLIDLWSLHRQGFSKGTFGQDSLCAIIFNASGYLHEITKPEESVKASPPTQYGGDE